MIGPRILERVFARPWAVMPMTHAAIRAALQNHAAGAAAAPIVQVEPDEEEDIETVDGVAIIPVNGILGQHLSNLETMGGGVDALDVAGQSRIDRLGGHGGPG